MNWFKKLFRGKEVWLGKTSKEMTQLDWEEYGQYKQDLVKVSDKIPSNGESIIFKSGCRFFRVREVGSVTAIK